jgi:hypothetical protein
MSKNHVPDKKEDFHERLYNLIVSIILIAIAVFISSAVGNALFNN